MPDKKQTKEEAEKVEKEKEQEEKEKEDKEEEEGEGEQDDDKNNKDKKHDSGAADLEKVTWKDGSWAIDGPHRSSCDVYDE